MSFICEQFIWNVKFTYFRNNKVTSYSAMTVSVIVSVVGETLMLIVFQKQIFKDFLNFRVYKTMCISC